jgi:hypothetical protein
MVAATLSKRTKVAAVLALIAASLFIASGYQANIGIYSAIESGLKQYTARQVGQVAVIPINVLALIAQLGGFAVLAGALLFLKNHITTGKFLVMIGTGQGIITVVITLVLDLINDGVGGIDYATNYVLWLMTSATGLGIVFSIIATSIAKPVSSKKSKK